ncbi:choice-of-anchor A family protein [Undibacterium sp. CY7W]|uniref:Choice-of-anchor A family protein n=1 Tax=Undibacterium rugosum TaxID=2762291 RepID=A0A923KVR5_9BURK|nr:choice-of-anchor A family protein [Undibacterium rugosum]MBC3935647.1 choice-of-anchor A family protein [Undibacterium rugosum]
MSRDIPMKLLKKVQKHLSAVVCRTSCRTGKATPTLRHLIRCSIVATALSTQLPVLAAGIDFGTAGAYAGFFFGNVTGMQNIDGHLALGGNLSTNAANIGNQIPANEVGPALIVGGSIVRFDGGWVGSYDPNNNYGIYGVSKDKNIGAYLDFRKSDFIPIDFVAERTYLTAMSEQLNSMRDTGSVKLEWDSILTLTGSNQDVEVFHLTYDQVTNKRSLEVAQIRQDAYVIINITGNKLRKVVFGMDNSALQLQKRRLIFNFPDADLINFTQVNMWGSILAPYACIRDSDGHIEGNVIAAQWNSGMAIANNLFQPKP